MNSKIKKLIVIILLFTISINYSKIVFAELPPDMRIKREIVTNDNAVFIIECYNRKDIAKVTIDLYRGMKGQELVSSIEKNVDTSVTDMKMVVDIQKDMGIVLNQGEKYYLDINAITVHGSKPSYYGNSSLFITPSAKIIDFSQQTEEDNAILKFRVRCKSDEYIMKAGVRVTCFGCIVGTMEKTIDKQLDEVSVKFDLKNEGKSNLLPNCNYQYNVYVITKSLKGWRNEGRVDTYGSFKTLEEASITKGSNKITKKNVIIRGNLLNPRGKSIEKYGLIIKRGNKVIGRCEKVCSGFEKNATSKQLKFHIKKDMKKIKLIKSKKYKYEIYSVVEGKKYMTSGILKVKRTIMKR